MRQKFFKLAKELSNFGQTKVKALFAETLGGQRETCRGDSQVTAGRVSNWLNQKYSLPSAQILRGLR